MCSMTNPQSAGSSALPISGNPQFPTYLADLRCADCGETYSAEVEQHRCVCGGILMARYNLGKMAREVPRSRIEGRPWGDGLWRYAELLPVGYSDARVTLGEG